MRCVLEGAGWGPGVVTRCRLMVAFGGDWDLVGLEGLCGEVEIAKLH